MDNPTEVLRQILIETACRARLGLNDVAHTLLGRKPYVFFSSDVAPLSDALVSVFGKTFYPKHCKPEAVYQTMRIAHSLAFTSTHANQAAPPNTSLSVTAGHPLELPVGNCKRTQTVRPSPSGQTCPLGVCSHTNPKGQEGEEGGVGLVDKG